MPSLKDNFLSFVFSHVYFLSRSSSTSIPNLVITSLSCSFQLWCLVWSFLSLVIDDPHSLVTKTKTYISRVFVLILISNCGINMILTIQLTFSRIAAKYTTLVNHHSKRRTFLEYLVLAWILTDFYKTCHTLYHYVKRGQTICSILILFSFNYLIFRLQVAVLYLGLRIENLALRFDVLNRELRLWLPLHRVIKINKQYHMLVNEIQAMSEVVGPSTLLFCLRSVGIILTNFYSLIFIQPDEILIKVLLWTRVKHILMHFVRVFFT